MDGPTSVISYQCYNASLLDDADSDKGEIAAGNIDDVSNCYNAERLRGDARDSEKLHGKIGRSDRFGEVTQ